MLPKCFIIGIAMASLAAFAHAQDQAGTSVLRTSALLTSVVRADPRTGKLVRVTVVHNAPREAAAAPDLRSLIDNIAEENQVEAPLVHSVIQTESNYNPLAVSNKGAEGLMQLIPATARRFGVRDSFNSTENVEGGVKYLKYLLDLYHGDYSRAVAAYNAGERAVSRYGGVPPYKETQNYVAQVTRHLETERRSFVPKPIAAAAAPDADPAETYNPVIASVSPDGKIYYKTSDSGNSSYRNPSYGNP
jgi:soluble lytic murein transglycosylase-like protein